MMLLFVQQPRMRANLTACVTIQFVMELLKRGTGLKAKLQILWVERKREGEIQITMHWSNVRSEE